MLRNPRVWLYAAGGWLIVTGLAHLGAHVWSFVLEQGMVGQREFAMTAMRQAISTDWLRPSLWTLFRSFSMSFGLLLLLGGLVDVVLAWTGAESRAIRSLALLGTLFWTGAFVLFAFVEPVIQPVVVALVAVPLHAVVVLTASEEARADPFGARSEPGGAQRREGD